jgi:hypothetical protein
MSLCKILTPTTDLKDQLSAVGSLLQGKTKNRIPTTEGIRLFKYQWTAECATLLRETSNAVVGMRELCNSITNYIEGGRSQKTTSDKESRNPGNMAQPKFS